MPSQIKDATSDWEIYTHPTYGVSFKYPPHYNQINYQKQYAGDYDVFFVSSESQRGTMEMCLKGNRSECNHYALGLRFEILKKSNAQDLMAFLEQDLNVDPKGYTISYLNGAAKPIEGPNGHTIYVLDGNMVLHKQVQGIGLADNAYIDNGSTVLHVFANSAVEEKKNMDICTQILSTFKVTK